MKNDVKNGGVGIWLDEIVPCLKDTETGEIKETVVFKIESRSFLKKSTKRTVGENAAKHLLETYTYEWN